MTQFNTKTPHTISLLSALIIANLSSAAVASDHYVDDDGLECPHSTYHTSIQDAVDAAVDGDTVYVYPGTYTGSGDEVVSLTFTDFSMYGVSVNGQRPKIDGENDRRCISIEGPDDLLTGEINVENFDLENGYAVRDGGGIHAIGDVEITDVNIFNCHAGGSGGALMVALPSFTQPGYTSVNFQYSQVDYCTANLNGGGLAADEATLRVYHNEVSRCFAGEKGGGIAFTSPIHNALLKITGSASSPFSLSMNEAGEGGGGLWLSGSRSHHLVGLLLFENRTRGNGGGALFEDTTVQLGRFGIGVEVTRNVAMEHSDLSGGKGAGLCLINAEVSHDEDSWFHFDSNASEGDGAAIYMKHSSLELSQALFEGNVAVNERGGAIAAISCPSLLLDEVYLWDNIGLKGGALYLMNTFAQLTNLDGRGNTGTNGAALFVRGASSDVSVSDSLFMNNSPRHVRVISGSCTNAGGNSFN